MGHRTVRNQTRSTLIEPTAERMEEFLAAVKRSHKLYGKGRWAAPPATAEAFRKNLGRLEDPRTLSFWVLTSGNELAGVVNVNEIIRGVAQSAYLGYYAFVPHNGQGHMTRGLGAVVARVFRRHNLHRLEANIQPENEASRRLVQRLGFRMEGYSPRYLKLAGRWRDHERWAILAEEWIGRRRGSKA